MTATPAAAPPATRTPKRASRPYAVPPGGQRACHCGHRNFTIRSGGVLPASVDCAKCRKQSRINTAYEHGREAGRQEVASACGITCGCHRGARQVAGAPARETDPAAADSPPF